MNLFADDVSLFLGMFLFIALCIYFVPKIKGLRFFPPILVVLIGGMILGNTGIMPQSSSVYDTLNLPALLLCIAGFMMVIDIRDVLKLGTSVLRVFFIGVIGMIIAACVSAPIAANLIGKEQAAQVSALISGTWLGGNSNFASISEAINVDASFIAVVLGINMVIANLHFVVMMAIKNKTNGINNWLKPKADLDEYFQQIEMKKPMLINKGTEFLIGLGLAGAIAWVSWKVGSYLGSIFPSLGGTLFTIILVSTIGLIIGRYSNIQQKVPGANMIGEIFLYLFLLLMGLKAGSPAALLTSPGVLLQLLIIMVIYMTIVIIGAKLFKDPFEIVNVSVNAQVGGAGTGVAISQAYSKSFVSTGILLSVLGNVVGKYIGIDI